jgi:N6-adenosine-specific RNA methylase IME4
VSERTRFDAVAEEVAGPSALARVFAAAVPREPYRVVCADPPWPFDDKLPGSGRGAITQYDLLDDAIASRQFVGGDLLDQVADDAYLFLWRVSAGAGIDTFTLVERAYMVARAWGFAPKTEIIWRKQTKNGARHFGMGWHLRMEHEACILATRGKPKPLVRNIRSVFDAKAPSSANGRAIHSAKPEAFYRNVVEKISRGPYLELFARERRSGWDSAGNELW